MSLTVIENLHITLCGVKDIYEGNVCIVELSSGKYRAYGWCFLKDFLKDSKKKSNNLSLRLNSVVQKENN